MKAEAIVGTLVSGAVLVAAMLMARSCEELQQTSYRECVKHHPPAECALAQDRRHR